MAESVARPDRATRINSIPLEMAKSAIERNPIEESTLADDAVSLFFETLTEIGMSEKEAALTMQVQPSHLSRVKSGEARLPFEAMWRLPNSFWFAFRYQIDVAKGLTAENQQAVRAARIAELVRLLIVAA